MAGKTDTRQKMINMMYLVFIAMLALNIGKEVLATLGVLNDDLIDSTEKLEEVINKSYSAVQKNSNQAYYKIPSEELPKIQKLSNDYFEYIQNIKNLLLNSDDNANQFKRTVTNSKTNKDSLMTNYQIMDNSQTLDEYFFAKDDIYTTEGLEFFNKFSIYKNEVRSVLDTIVLRDKEKEEEAVGYAFDAAFLNLESRFNIPETQMNSDGKDLKYLKYHYLGFPLIASLTKLTKIQSDIRNVERSILNPLIQQLQEDGLSIDNNNAETFIDTGGKSYPLGSIVDASIIVGKTNSEIKPDSINLNIDGRPIIEGIDFEVINGKIVLNKRFNTIGEKKITGDLVFKSNGKRYVLPVDETFKIIERSDKAVVSAENMKVFYRGLRNPTSISVPNADASSIRVRTPESVANFNKIDNKIWEVTPNTRIDSMQVRVSANLNGRVTNFDGGWFRVKTPPDGLGSVLANGNYAKDDSELSSFYISNGVVTGSKPIDFDYKYDIIVTSFDVKVGRLTVKNVQGNRINRNSSALNDVESSNVGTKVRFQNIQAKTIDGSVETPGYSIKPFTLYIR